MTRPLCGRVTPIAGESLASVVARSACANVSPSTAKLLRQAGIRWGQPAFVPFTQNDSAPQLADLLGISIDDVTGRMHTKIAGERSNRVDWFGTPLERRFLEAPRRRFSRLGLQSADFARATWMVRPLSFCPENFDRLQHECPHCDACLGWDRALGISVCEKCEGDIRSGTVDLLPEELRPDYSVIAGLVSTDPARRAECLGGFPAPFCNWQPGDLFSAVVDLGFARGSPETPSSSPLANGDFSDFQNEHLFLGYDLLMRWDDVFPNMLQEIISGQAQASTRGTPNSLGLLRRFFYANASQTPLVDLMRAEIPPAIRNLNMPLRVARNSVLLGVKREGTISLRDAKDKYRIDNRILARLVDTADCFIARHDSKFGTRLFDEEGLATAIDAFRTATTIEVLARQLGVPPCIVEACEKVGLFTRVNVNDAQLLAGSMTLYDPHSVTAFIGALERQDGSPTVPSNVSLLQGMRGQLSPSAWAHIFKALAEGALPFEIDREKGAWSSSILVQRSDLKGALRALPGYPLPDDLRVSMGNAALFLHESATSLGSVARAGLLTAERHDTGYSVALRDLDAFHRAFVFSQEVNETHGRLDPPWRHLVDRAGLKPVGCFGGHNCWNRRALNAIIDGVGNGGITIR